MGLHAAAHADGGLAVSAPACSFHCGSGCHSSEAYQQAVQMARQVRARLPAAPRSWFARPCSYSSYQLGCVVRCMTTSAFPCRCSTWQLSVA